VFLKACQEHFHLAQTNLFDITDLEDLNKRRGTTYPQADSGNDKDNQK